MTSKLIKPNFDQPYNIIIEGANQDTVCQLQYKLIPGEVELPEKIKIIKTNNCTYIHYGTTSDFKKIKSSDISKQTKLQMPFSLGSCEGYRMGSQGNNFLGMIRSIIALRDDYLDIWVMDSMFGINPTNRKTKRHIRKDNNYLTALEGIVLNEVNDILCLECHSNYFENLKGRGGQQVFSPIKPILDKHITYK
mgnify:CR=1 FL=1|jgi:hypothetical protein